MGVIFNQYRLESMVIVPVSVDEIQTTENIIKKKLMFMGVNGTNEMVNAISFASAQNNISPDLIIALTWTESGFKTYAKSSLGYKGLMQIPHSVYYNDANILIGTRILREKLNYAQGDMKKALLMYKGYPLDSARGHEQVEKVFALYYKIRRIC